MGCIVTCGYTDDLDITSCKLKKKKWRREENWEDK